jgi:hypothetical protein
MRNQEKNNIIGAFLSFKGQLRSKGYKNKCD